MCMRLALALFQVPATIGDPSDDRYEMHRSLPVVHDDMVVFVVRCAGHCSFEGRSVTEQGVTPRPMIEHDTAWHDVQQCGVEGKGWSDTARFYDRLPARAEASVRHEVWDLSRCSAGMLTRFATDSSVIHARYTLRSPALALPHMPASSVSGIDLYAQGSDGRDRWLAGTAPTGQVVETPLVVDVKPGMRRYTAYLPLYNEVDSLQIGVDPAASFVPTQPRTRKPLLFYGSSIVQGACATRPGSTFTAMLGRRFDKPVVNLGFSGNALMEPEVGALIAELDPSVFVLDCLPNMQPNEVAQRSETLVRRIRAARPSTPILMVEDRTQSHAWLIEEAWDRHRDNRAAYRDAYRRLISSGIRKLAYLEGSHLLPDDGEGTVDGSHPNDVGMASYAAAYAEELKRLLQP